MPPPSTRWSLVARAAEIGSPAGAQALAELCAVWRPAVLAFLARRGDPAEAEDLAQSFFLHFIEQRLPARADPGRGRFRGYVYTALRHWLEDRRRAAHAGKRATHALDRAVDPEQVAGDDADPAIEFDRAWAQCLVREALRQLRCEAARSGRLALYEAARPFLLEGPEAGAYAQAAQSLAMRPNTFAVAVARLRTQLQRRVRALVEDSSVDAEVAAGELRHLRALFAAPD